MGFLKINPAAARIKRCVYGEKTARFTLDK